MRQLFWGSLLLLSCISFSCRKSTATPDLSGIDFRAGMRKFVEEISSFAKNKKNGFIVIPQNGEELLTDNGERTGTLQSDYLFSIDAVGREELHYGFDNNDDLPTPAEEADGWLALCTLAKNNGLGVMVTDYATTPSKIADSYQQNAAEGFISFAAEHRELDYLPSRKPYLENSGDIDSINEARNFLYLINTGAYATAQDMLNALKQTNYDVILIDLYFQEAGSSRMWTQAEIDQLKKKSNGGIRLVIAYMSIGEAEDYRYYWQKSWINSPPAWLENENPQWKGNYKVKYWMPDWKQYITGTDQCYTQKIIDAGFDGAYLDIIDAFEYWEEK
jgi:cysteinyl-tRNA synthetase, unknown class